MRKLNVVFYAIPTGPAEWYQPIREAISARHNLKYYDFSLGLEQFAGAEAVVDLGGGAKRAMVDAAPKAGLWQIFGTGLDNVDLPYLKSRGILVANCPGSSSCVGLAECAMMFILMLTRRWRETQANLAQGVFFKPSGRSLVGLTLAIVGFGASGREVARRARGFGMRIEAIDPVRPDSRTMAELQPDFMGTPDDLDQVAARCDFLSLHLPLNESTRHIIDARRMALMKPTACIINVARGPLVDEAAMHRALLAGKLGGAGLDVFGKEPPDMSEPAFQLPNVIMTPHVSGQTDDTLRRRIAMMMENLDRFAEKRDILYRVA